MDSDKKLDDEILRAISKPMAYPEIEKIIGPQEGYALGIALSRMAASKFITKNRKALPPSGLCIHATQYRKRSNLQSEQT